MPRMYQLWPIWRLSLSFETKRAAVRGRRGSASQGVKANIQHPTNHVPSGAIRSEKEITHMSGHQTYSLLGIIHLGVGCQGRILPFMRLDDLLNTQTKHGVSRSGSSLSPPNLVFTQKIIQGPEKRTRAICKSVDGLALAKDGQRQRPS